MKLKSRYDRWDTPNRKIWDTEEHIFLRVERAYLATDRGVEVDGNIAHPMIKATSVGFSAWIVEPGETKCNMWDFHVRENREVWGRPAGASVSSYRPPGTTKRRKPGEWYLTPWVPKGTIEASLALFVDIKHE